MCILLLKNSLVLLLLKNSLVSKKQFSDFIIVLCYILLSLPRKGLKKGLLGHKALKVQNKVL